MKDTALNEKWAALINDDSVPAIKDEYRREVTAILLENQEQALQEAAPTNVAAGVAGYDPILISMLRRAAPHLIAFDICGLQPMKAPTGLVFYAKARYTAQNGTEALFDEADTSFSGTGNHSSFLGVSVMAAAVTSGSANVTVASTTNISAGMPISAPEFPAGTTVSSVTNSTVFVASANATATNATTTVQIGVAVGAGIVTATAEGDISAKMAFSIDKVSVEAKSFQLASGYSLEMQQDMKVLHGLEADSEISKILGAELVTETNRRVLRSVYNLAKPGSQKTTLPGVFNFATDTDGRWSNEKFKGLLFNIERDLNAIAVDMKFGKGNIMICSGDIASALAAAGTLNYAPALAQLEQLNADFTQSTFVGTISGRVKVFVDPYADADFYCVGYKGPSPYEAGCFYTPYVAAQLLRATDPGSFQPLMAMKSRAGFVANPFSGSTFRSNGFYRISQVTNLHG